MNKEFTASNTVKKTLTSLVTKTMRIIAPELSKKIAHKILLTPKRTKNVWPSHVKQFKTRTRYGSVRTYKYGQGKCIWLVHGWSSCAFDFWPLMQQLAESGYSTITFDFPAHGLSKGKQSSLPQMIRVFEDVSSALFEPNMVIAHSMGASIVANSGWFKQYRADLLLISPVLDSYALMQKLVSHSGFDQVLFDQVIHDIFKKDKLLIPNLNSVPKLKEFTGKLKIIHDKHDSYAPLSMSEQLSEQSEAKLITTNRLGHKKILRSKNIVKVVDSYTNMQACSELTA
ncbi:MAG: alpha/beta hydrolase [Colwellia sp.]|nr:alpha/beta hydrolase [Colwellia sp.]